MSDRIKTTRNFLVINEIAYPYNTIKSISREMVQPIGSAQLFYSVIISFIDVNTENIRLFFEKPDDALEIFNKCIGEI